MAITASHWLLMCRNCSWRLACLMSLPIAMNSKGTVQFIAGVVEHRSHGKHNESFLHSWKMSYLLSRAMLISDTLIVVRVWQLMNKPLPQQVTRTISCTLPRLTGLTLLNSNRSVLRGCCSCQARVSQESPSEELPDITQVDKTGRKMPPKLNVASAA